MIVWLDTLKGMGVKHMPKRKKDPSKGALNSPNVEGQGTTTTETGSVTRDSSRKKTKRN
jgi:hypothetical protein